MNLNIFKGLADTLSLNNYKTRSKLSKDFNLYLKSDIHLALSMLDNGYEPTFLQKNNMNVALFKESENINFLNRFQNSFHHVSNEVIINYLTTHDLGTECANKKTIYENSSAKLLKLKDRKKFSQEVKTALILNINKHGIIVSKFKPKYPNTHGFHFNQQEQKIYNQFTNSIYNSLILMRGIVDNINDFLEIKSAIQSNIISIKNLVQKNNYKITDYDGTIIHNHRSNMIMFKIETLDSWYKFLEEYNIDNFKKEILEKTKSTFSKNNPANDLNIVQETPKPDPISEITEKILALNSELNQESQEKVAKIIDIYTNIRKNHNQPETYQDQENLYQDLHKVIKKFLSIDIDYRQTLRNIEGKNPEELMYDSIIMIEKQFDDYITAINQDKVHDLSAHQKKIKMKA